MSAIRICVLLATALAAGAAAAVLATRGTAGAAGATPATVAGAPAARSAAAAAAAAQGATPSAALPPLRPLFKTQALVGTGRRGPIGYLYGVGGLRRLPRGTTVELRCLAGCSGRMTSRLGPATPRVLQLRPRTRIVLRARALVELRATAPEGGDGRWQRYRLRRTRRTLDGRRVPVVIAHATAGGCLATAAAAAPRRLRGCPPAGPRGGRPEPAASTPAPSAAPASDATAPPPAPGGAAAPDPDPAPPAGPTTPAPDAPPPTVPPPDTAPTTPDPRTVPPTVPSEEPATRPEQASGYGAGTYADPYGATDPGPRRIEPQEWVEVSCKVHAPDIPSANPDGYWYRIASPPWNGGYYAVANTFWNGDVPGQPPYTHNTDPAVPDCPDPPPRRPAG